MAQHRSFLLLPDPKLTGAASVHAASSEGGRVPGRGTPLSDNEGNLSAFITGRADSDDASFDLRIQTSGGIVEGATWAWRRRGETDSDWRGANDRRFLHTLEDPFHPGSGGAISVARTEILYSEKLNREFVYMDGSGDNLAVRWRSVGESEGAWNSATATFDGGIDFNGSEAMMFAGCVLPDGAFRMVVYRNNDLDIYHSEDGLTWQRVADNIFSRFAGRLSTSFDALWLVESGGYLMITAVEDDVDGVAGLGTYMTTLVSSDRGSTWREIDYGQYPLGLILAKYGPSGVDRYGLSVVGVGDAAGTFFYTGRSNASTSAFITLSRSGFGSWSLFQTVALGTSTFPVAFDRAILGRTATHIVALFIDFTISSSRVVSTGEYAFATLDRRISLANQDWVVSERITFFDGSPASRLGLGHTAWIGSSLAVFGKKYDWQTGARVDGSLYFRLGEGWSKAPLSDLVWDGYESFSARPVGYQPIDGPLFDGIEWHAAYGIPRATTYSSWRLLSTGGAIGYRDDRMELFAPAGDSIVFEYRDAIGAAPSQSWMTTSDYTVVAGSLVEWECSVQTSTSPNKDMGIRLISRDVSVPGDAVEIQVVMDQTDLELRDGLAGTLLATLTPDPSEYGATPFADRWEFRLCFVPRPNLRPRQVLVMARKYGTTDWITTPIVTFATFPRTISASTVTQSVRFGILTTPPSGAVAGTWWALRIHSGDDLRQAVQVKSGDPLLADETRPHVVRGRQCSPFPVAIVDGVEASWGGGGGFDGDLFESIVSYQYAAQNLLLGPRFQWRSADSPPAGTNIIFTAGSEDHARFRHDALALIGCNASEATVDYDDDPAFPSPTSAGTLDLERFSGLRISAVDGESVTIAGASLPADGEVSSSDARRFFARVTAAPAGATSISVGDVFEIDEQRGDVLDMASGLFLAATVGTTLSIYSDRGVLSFGSAIVGRYLRITLPTVSPPAGRFEIGAVVAGTTMPFGVPLEWEHTDDDQPVATTFRSRSGISWAYVEGPPQRTVTGTVVGDAGTFRARLRNLLRSTSRYVEKPVVLCMDESDLTNAETTMLARIPDGVSFEQTGWRYLEDEDRWIPVGDASLTFEQDA